MDEGGWGKGLRPIFALNSTFPRRGQLFIKTGQDRLDEGVVKELAYDLPSVHVRFDSEPLVCQSYTFERVAPNTYILGSTSNATIWMSAIHVR
jgi:hypothetical protein